MLGRFVMHVCRCISVRYRCYWCALALCRFRAAKSEFLHSLHVPSHAWLFFPVPCRVCCLLAVNHKVGGQDPASPFNSDPIYHDIGNGYKARSDPYIVAGTWGTYGHEGRILGMHAAVPVTRHTSKRT